MIVSKIHHFVSTKYGLTAGLWLAVFHFSNAQQVVWARQLSGKGATTQAMGFTEQLNEKALFLFTADHPVRIGNLNIKSDDSSLVRGLEINVSGGLRLTDSIPTQSLNLYPKTEGNPWLVKSKPRNGNYYLAYGLSSPTRLPVELNWSLAFMDANGHRLWEKRLPDRQKVSNLTLLVGGQCLIVGSETGPRGNPDISIALWNEYGQELWHRRIGSMSEDEALCSACDAEGNLYVGGYFSADSSFMGNTDDLSGREKDGFLACYDQKGNQKFFYRQRGQGFNSVEAISIAQNGQVLFASRMSGKNWKLPPFGFIKEGTNDIVLGLIDPRLKAEKATPLEIFPNPAREVVYFSLNEPLAKEKKTLLAKLHKKDGPAIQTLAIKNESGVSFRFNVGNTPPGAYYITIEGKKGKISERLLVE